MIPTRVNTREEWLMLAVAQMRPVFEEVGATIPDVRVSVGWPGGRGSKDSVIGQCWHKAAATDEHFHIFISPVLDDAPRVLDVLLHELVHAADGNESGHKGRFTQWAKALGLTGKMTATVAGPELAEALSALVRDNLGAYPHGALNGGGTISGKPGGPEAPVPGAPGGGTQSHPKQGTRMVKVSCDCDKADPYILRMTRKQIERGLPGCGLCGQRMTVDGEAKPADEPDLSALETFRLYAEDAGNWSGNPWVFDGNVLAPSGVMADLAVLERAGLLKVCDHGGQPFLAFTERGKALAVKYGIEGTEYWSDFGL